MLRLNIFFFALSVTLIGNVVGVAMRQDEYDDLVAFLHGIDVPNSIINGT
jgi:hypothetical protein